MSAKFKFRIVDCGFKLNCTAACVLSCIVYRYIQWSLSSILQPVSRFRSIMVTTGLLPQTAVIGSTNHQLQNDMLLIYTSTLAVITIITIFATLAIPKSAKLLDYSSMPSTFDTLFLSLITNSLKDPGYHGCLCREGMRMSAMQVAMEARVLPYGWCLLW